MTDNLLQKLEEKVMTLVTELEDLRKETQRLRQENSLLRADKTTQAQKLQGLVSLLEAVDVVAEPTFMHVAAHGRREEVAAL